MKAEVNMTICVVVDANVETKEEIEGAAYHNVENALNSLCTDFTIEVNEGETKILPDITIGEVEDSIKECGRNLFGKNTDEVAERHAQQVCDEYLEDDDPDITIGEVEDFIKECGRNLFGKKTDEVAEKYAQQVYDEYLEADDGDLQKAFSYVVLDAIGAL